MISEQLSILYRRCFGGLCDTLQISAAADVRSAVEEMYADRLGHGYAGVLDSSTLGILKAHPSVHLEACPVSAEMEGHLELVGRFREEGLNFGLNEDDPAPGFGNTTMAAIEELVRSRLGFSTADVNAAYERARAAAFAPSAMFIL